MRLEIGKVYNILPNGNTGTATLYLPSVFEEIKYNFQSTFALVLSNKKVSFNLPLLITILDATSLKLKPNDLNQYDVYKISTEHGIYVFINDVTRTALLNCCEEVVMV